MNQKVKSTAENIDLLNSLSPSSKWVFLMASPILVAVTVTDALLKNNGFAGGIEEVLTKTNTTFRTQIGRVNV